MISSMFSCQIVQHQQPSADSEEWAQLSLWMRLVSARLQCSSAAADTTPLAGLYPGKTLLLLPDPPVLNTRRARTQHGNLHQAH
ncbi:hypothetical protein CgunFtcFv8_022645 [Champsocephalus gunnari]|uniref:Uncharacterized protein n=1 Tax=Champsocephalus gunnari TaxID=52237 RepID=A0AAN8HSV8_CHAGU|nr:hypothetical protein CgunFtcFv8_022645 [Champsocephalus gunnari]